MIDLTTETLVSFTEACQRLPRRRAGKRPHPNTLYRWASGGGRGERLETIRVGGTLCTSLEALQRFFDRLTGGADRDGQHPPALSQDGAPSNQTQLGSRGRRNTRNED